MVAPCRVGLGCYHSQAGLATLISPSSRSCILVMNCSLAFPVQARGPGWSEPCAGTVPVPRTSFSAMLVLFARVLGALGDLARALQAAWVSSALLCLLA